MRFIFLCFIPVILGCPSGYTAFTGTSQCVRFVSEALPWYDAIDRCKSDGATLASVHSGFENAQLRSIATAAGASTGLVSLGGKRGADSWEWSDFTYWNYEHWAPGQGKQGAVAAFNTEDSTWQSIAYDSNLPFFCEKTVYDKNCTEGWIENKDICYKYVLTKETPEDTSTKEKAEKYCVENGAHLLSIHDTDEQQVATALATGVHCAVPLIGLECDLGVYKWTDGSPANYRNDSEVLCSGYYGIYQNTCGNGDVGYWRAFDDGWTFESFVCKKRAQ